MSTMLSIKTPINLTYQYSVAAFKYNLESHPAKERQIYRATYSQNEDLLRQELRSSAFQRALTCSSIVNFQNMQALDKTSLVENFDQRQLLENHLAEANRLCQAKFPPSPSANLSDLQLLMAQATIDGFIPCTFPVVVIYPGNDTHLNPEELADYFADATRYPTLTQKLAKGHPVQQLRTKTPFADWFTSSSQRPPFAVYPLIPYGTLDKSVQFRHPDKIWEFETTNRLIYYTYERKIVEEMLSQPINHV